MRVRFRSPKQQAPEREKGMRVAYAPAKRVMARWRWYLILLLVSLPLIYLVGQILHGWLIVSAPGDVVLRKVPINSQATGVLVDLAVRTGQEVPAGTVVATLASAELDHREAVLAAEVVTFQRRHRDDVQFLFDQGAATRAERSLAERQLHAALLDYENVHADLIHMQVQVDRAAVPDEEARVRAAVVQAELAALDRAREVLVLKSPIAGRVLELLAESGQSLAPGDPILVMGDTSQPEIHAYLAARYADYARAGLAVTVFFQDGQRRSGVVTRPPEVTRRLPAAVSSPMGSRENRLLVPIQLLERDAPEHLVEGLPVTVRFPFRFFPVVGNGGLAISRKIP